MKAIKNIVLLVIFIVVLTTSAFGRSDVIKPNINVVAKDSVYLHLPAVLGDNMVLQRETNTIIWGKGYPESKIKIQTSWNNKKYTNKVDRTGNWKIAIETGKAGGPFTITIQADTTIVLKNILLGEVWLCSGQSNMEMLMNGKWNGRVAGSIDEIALSKNENIRLFTEESQPATEPCFFGKGKWQESKPSTVANFSAVAWFYGSYLNKALNVPVGLIVSAVGGTPVQEWMPENSLKKYKTEELLKRYKNLKIENKQELLSRLYNGKISPLTQYRIKGAIWYQGEANTIDFPYTYNDYFSSMIESWRDKWGYNFPFYFVQLAPYDYSRSYTGALIREAQLKVMKNVPNTGMAVILDIGERENIHPEKKREVGNRLAYWALGNAYNIDGIRYTAPVYDSYNVEDSTIIVNFKCIGEWGIFPMKEDVPFLEIAGNDKVFYPAKAKIDWKNKGKSILVWSPKVKKPVAVRYCFRNWCKGTLSGKNELPVSSFRTDNWELDIKKIK